MLLSFKLIKGKHYLKKIIINKNSKVFDQLEKKNYYYHPKQIEKNSSSLRNNMYKICLQ